MIVDLDLLQYGYFPLDKKVLEVFPKGTKVLSSSRFGTSAWTVTARVKVEHPDGSSHRYFLKCGNKLAIEGEFYSMSELYRWMPDFVPEPHAWGKCEEDDHDMYFLLSQYLDMDEGRLPDPKQLCTKLAKLHKISTSPTGQFGFHVSTCQGRQPQYFQWEQSWTVFFEKALRYLASADFDINGPWAELEALEQRIFSEVIPRLIGALEREGRIVKPCLIHNDLWEGNTGTAFADGAVYAFDSGALYAHNEMEIGNWRCNYNKIHNKVYTRTYLSNFGPCEPKEEWDDRNRMYSIYYNIIYSCNHASQGKLVRQTAYDDMYFLIDKYAPFPEGEGPRRLVEGDYATLSAERDHTMA